MAKLNEQVIVITVSQMLPNGVAAVDPLDGEAVAQLEAIVKELAGGNCLVETLINPE
jgi:hypothetical protein